MTSEPWERLERLFGAAVELGEPARAAFLDRECAGEPELRRELDSLLAAHTGPAGVLDVPALEPFAEPAPTLLPAGLRLGAWQLVGLLGRGGAGDVYRAVRADGSFEQSVAIKILQPGAEPERFETERRLLARLEHPGIGRILDGGVAPDGRLYAVLELVDGLPLTLHCQERRLGLEARLDLFAQVCAAVSHAHRHLVVHRDLKPGNILVTAEGQVKLLDFGIAKPLPERVADEHTRAPLTLDYAAPEQLTGDPISTATDVYALGVVLFELLVGARPFRSEGLPVARALTRLLEETAPAPSAVARREESPPVAPERLAGDLDAVVAKCLRKDPAGRYSSVETLAEDLARHRALEPVQARHGQRLYRLGRFLRRHRWPAAAALALVLSLVVGVAAFAWQAARAERERDAARRAAAREEAIRDHLMRLFRTSLEETVPGAEPVSAKAMLDRSAQRVVEQYRGDPELAGVVVETLADLYGALGDAAGQRPLLEGFLAAAGPEAPPRAVALARQKLAALLLVVPGERERVQTLLGEAEAFWQANPDRFREERLEGLFVRAQLERALGDVGGSIATFQKAIAERLEVSGRLHRETATLYNSLALSLALGQRQDEALAAYQEALAIQAALGRSDEPDTLVMRAGLGALLLRTGRLREAEQVLAAAWPRLRAALGETPAVAAAMGQLGAARSQGGAPAEALPMLTEAAALAQRLTGEASSLTIQNRLFRAEALAAVGRREEAERALADNLAVTRTQLGEGHVLTVLLRLARAQQLAADPAASLAELDALAPALAPLAGLYPTFVARADHLRGSALLALGRVSEALASLRAAVAVRERVLWAGSAELAESRARLSEALAAAEPPSSRGGA